MSIASDYAQRSLVSANRHELRNLEAYSQALSARVAELNGEWDEAADLAREVLDMSAITQMVALPIVSVIEARKGRPGARELVLRAWEMASRAGEIQRLAPAAAAAAEEGWISGEPAVPVDELAAVMRTGVDAGFVWSPGKVAFWLWQLDELSSPPAGIAEPFAWMMNGSADDAVAVWQARGAPYVRALALMRCGEWERLQAIEALEVLGATAVASRYRLGLRAQGLTVPRGHGQATRRHAAGLTARQAEVLQLMAEGLTNAVIADRLFISSRTAENHVSAVFDKLDVGTRDEAVRRAHADGMLPA